MPTPPHRTPGAATMEAQPEPVHVGTLAKGHKLRELYMLMDDAAQGRMWLEWCETLRAALLEENKVMNDKFENCLRKLLQGRPGTMNPDRPDQGIECYKDCQQGDWNARNRPKGDPRFYPQCFNPACARGVGPVKSDTLCRAAFRAGDRCQLKAGSDSVRLCDALQEYSANDCSVQSVAEEDDEDEDIDIRFETDDAAATKEYIGNLNQKIDDSAAANARAIAGLQQTVASLVGVIGGHHSAAPQGQALAPVDHRAECMAWLREEFLTIFFSCCATEEDDELDKRLVMADGSKRDVTWGLIEEVLVGAGLNEQQRMIEQGRARLTPWCAVSAEVTRASRTKAGETLRELLVLTGPESDYATTTTNIITGTSGIFPSFWTFTSNASGEIVSAMNTRLASQPSASYNFDKGCFNKEAAVWPPGERQYHQEQSLDAVTPGLGNADFHTLQEVIQFVYKCSGQNMLSQTLRGYVNQNDTTKKIRRFYTTPSSKKAWTAGGIMFGQPNQIHQDFANVYGEYETYVQKRVSEFERANKSKRTFAKQNEHLLEGVDHRNTRAKDMYNVVAAREQEQREDSIEDKRNELHLFTRVATRDELLAFCDACDADRGGDAAAAASVAENYTVVTYPCENFPSIFMAYHNRCDLYHGLAAGAPVQAKKQKVTPKPKAGGCQR